jgi:hypothetical protein
MIKLRDLFNSQAWLEHFLILSISLFVGAAFVLYLLIIKSRSKNIRQERLRIAYSSLIEKLMFSVVFHDMVFSDLKNDNDYKKLSKNTFSREVTIETIIDLHKNYDGVYAQKLEQFYQESGLINDSLKRLKSLKWEIRCKGITELAEMNVTETFDSIITISKSRNKTLKITALNACIKLGGTKGITHLAAYPYPIDEWTQINIIASFKKHDVGDKSGIELLLESENTTVIALGLKLIKELKLTQKVPYVAKLAARATNAQIKYEAENLLKTLTVY